MRDFAGVRLTFIDNPNGRSGHVVMRFGVLLRVNC